MIAQTRAHQAQPDINEHESFMRASFVFRTTKKTKNASHQMCWQVGNHGKIGKRDVKRSGRNKILSTCTNTCVQILSIFRTGVEYANMSAVI